MTDHFKVRHEDQRAITNADQAELRAIQNGSAVPDAGIRDEQLSGELEELADGQHELERWAEHDVAADDEVGAIRDEIKRRIDLMGDAYPFKLSNGSIVHRKSASGLYEYCLGVCYAPSITAGEYVKLPRSFERISGLIASKHLGPRWRMHHTGAPRSDFPRFDEAMKNMSKVACDGQEWVWNPDRGFPEEWVPGDCGLDFLIWKPAPDRRIGQLYVVGQCACGNDWSTKFDDLKKERLEPWFRPLTYIPFIRCFTTPFLLSNGNFDIASRNAGWVLDRARLAMLAHEAAVDGDEDFQAQYPLLADLFDLAAAA